MTELEDPVTVASLAHAELAFNAPLSDARADALVRGLQAAPDTHVLDLGCGWGELLLRILEATPGARGVGVDTNAQALARGRAEAERRSLSERVAFLEHDAAATTEMRAETVVCVGASHAWGGTRSALTALYERVPPGGRLLYADGFWQAPATPEALAALGAAQDDHGSLVDLVNTVESLGFMVLDCAVASQDEWDTFESRWCGGLVRWLHRHREHPQAARIEAVLRAHRSGYLGGYRGVLGFAYLTLLR